MIRFIKTLLSKKANPSSKAESAPTDEAATNNTGPTPDEQSTDADVSMSSEPTAPAADEVEIQRRFNEFERRFNERQKEILDARAAYIERWLVAISVVAVVGGYFGFTKFDKIEDEARQHVTAAKQHAEKAQILVEKIEAKYGESVSLVAEHKKLTAETVGKNPDEAGRAAESVQENPAASLIDRAMAAAVQLQLQGEIEKAAEKWRAIIHIAEGNDNDLAARAWLSVGYLFSLQEKHEDAIAAYDEAVRLKPNDALAYNNRGVAKNSLGRHEAAIADYNQAIQLKPDYALAYINRGVAKNALGHREAAIADYDEAIRLKSDDALAYFNRGNAKNALGHHEAAIADYNQAIQLKPDYAKAYFNRGAAKDGLGHHEAAIADYNQVIQLKPDYAKAYFNRGAAKDGLGHHEAAIADYNQAIQLKPNLAEAYNNRGTAKYDLGHREDAIADFDEAIRLKPDYAKAYNNRGKVKSKLRRIDEARRDFEKVRDLARKAGNDSLAASAEQNLQDLNNREGE